MEEQKDAEPPEAAVDVDAVVVVLESTLVFCWTGRLVAVVVVCIVAVEGGLKEHPATDWQHIPPSDVA